MGPTDVFVVYQDGFPIVTGTAKECAEVLGISDKTIRAYARPSGVERERTGRCNRMAVRVEEGDANG